MKIVHCVGWYFPDFVGGSEIYVQRLARELQQLGHDVAILAPRDGRNEDRYSHQGIPVFRYPVPEERSRAQHEGAHPHPLFELFEQQLREIGADVFHLHSYTYGAGTHHLRAARAQGMSTLVTAHTPGFVCARGTMMLYGREACDGRIEAMRCASCWLATRGIAPALAEPLTAGLAWLPNRLCRAAPGRMRALATAPSRMSRARPALLELADNADRIVAVCRWLHEALLLNGVPASKLVLCRQGVATSRPDDAHIGPSPDPRSNLPLRVGYFGRGSREKGVDVLVRAVCALPASVGLELRVHALVNSREDRDYMSEVRALARGDTRIAFAAPLPSDAVRQAMRSCDLVAVPSRWLETGPLVAMEALAAGVPVLGSDLGGLAELVEPGVTGWLLPAEQVGRWTAQLAALAIPGAARLHFAPDRLALASEVDVARRMVSLYADVTAERRGGA